MSSSASKSFYFASHRSTSNANSTEIDHLSPRQEKKLTKLSSARSASAAVEAEPAVMEKIPTGARPEEFYSRPVPYTKTTPSPKRAGGAAAAAAADSTLTAEERYESHQMDMVVPGYQDLPVGSLLLERKVPVKLEPKGFFAVERTFLLWMHSALWLLAASFSMLAYGYKDPHKLIYGVTMLPVALAFICYALFRYIRRIQMLRRKAPGPYEDIAGPTVLALALMAAIVAQFGMKVYFML